MHTFPRAPQERAGALGPALSCGALPEGQQSVWSGTAFGALGTSRSTQSCQRWPIPRPRYTRHSRGFKMFAGWCGEWRRAPYPGNKGAHGLQGSVELPSRGRRIIAEESERKEGISMNEP